MSKRYDEYVNKMNNNFSTEVIPMIPNIDSKLSMKDDLKASSKND